ncbi:MAG: hypothetical protein R3E08_14880 [Thiotrichaceae bacterium]
MGADFTPVLSRTWYLAGAYKIDDQVDDYLSIFNQIPPRTRHRDDRDGATRLQGYYLHVEAKRRYSFYLHNALEI